MLVGTDGSCIGNPGPGGWAWCSDDGRSGSGGARRTTNNRMEMRAVLELLRAVPASEPLVVVTDSKYTLNVFTTWLDGWRRSGWRTASGGRVENQDLIVAIDAELQAREVLFEWVPGHSGHELNERADSLANSEARRAADAWLRE